MEVPLIYLKCDSIYRCLASTQDFTRACILLQRSTDPTEGPVLPIPVRLTVATFYRFLPTPGLRSLLECRKAFLITPALAAHCPALFFPEVLVTI
jgi:hypothetical protein